MRDYSDLLSLMQEEKSQNYSGGIYHLTKLLLTYHSNNIEGILLTLDQVESILDTNYIKSDHHAINIDDIVETVNHFSCIDSAIDNAGADLTEDFIKNLHRILYTGTSSSKKEWFRVGDYKMIQNAVGNLPTTAPDNVESAMKMLLGDYNSKTTISLENILDFHVHFEEIHPFQDGNGRIGRLLIFRECLRHHIQPFILEADVKGRYFHGLQEWNLQKDCLVSICLEMQNHYKEYLNYFEIYRL